MHARLRPQGFALFSILLTIACICGCATPRPYLIVNYEVPRISDQLVGQKVRIEVKDVRQDAQAFTPAAAEHFKDFQNRYSLTWVSENKGRIFAGEKDLPELFLETFKKRLEQMGAEVVYTDRAEIPLFQVLISSMKVDLRERKWIAQASYEASLSVDSQIIAREKVSGEGEKPYIIGRKGADDSLSDIFTSVINKVDIVKLFQQAKMI
ncbi:MAG: hypothetical protein HZB87_06305 [Desulfatitalea sp.]|nr:hypothetical protein [Desulfatitalea sp.]